MGARRQIAMHLEARFEEHADQIQTRRSPVTRDGVGSRGGRAAGALSRDG